MAITADKEAKLMARVNSGEISWDWLSHAVMLWAALMFKKELEDATAKRKTV